MIYMAMGLFVSFFSFLRVFVRYRTEVVEWFFILTLVYISTFRSIYVGADTFNYTEFFRLSPDLFNFDNSYLNYLEPGFRLYMSIIKVFSSSQEFFLFVSSLFCILPLYFGLKKLKLEYSLVGLMVFLMVFFVPYSLNALRQAIVMSLFIYSLSFFNDKKTLIIILLTILATSIHSSGILIVFSYLLYSLDYKKSVILSILSLMLLMVFSYFGFAQYIVFDLGGVDSDVYTVKFNETTSITQYISRLILIAVIGFFSFNQSNIFFKKIFILYLFGFFVYLALSENNMLATRFNMFFRVLEVVIIPLILSSIDKVVVRFLVFMFFCVFFFFVYYATSILPENIYEFQR